MQRCMEVSRQGGWEAGRQAGRRRGRADLPYAVRCHGSQEKGEGRGSWLVRQIIEEAEGWPRGGDEGREGGGRGGGQIAPPNHSCHGT